MRYIRILAEVTVDLPTGVQRRFIKNELLTASEMERLNVFLEPLFYTFIELPKTATYKYHGIRMPYSWVRL